MRKKINSRSYHYAFAVCILNFHSKSPTDTVFFSYSRQMQQAQTRGKESTPKGTNEPKFS